MRDARGLASGDQIVFRIEEHRALVARTADLLEVAGSVDVPVSKRGVSWDEVRRIDFAESYLVACAEASGVTGIASFDRALDRVTTIRRVEP